MPKLTKRLVDQAEGPDPDGTKNQVIFWDDEVSGFGLRVTKAGTKSYIIQYRNSAGRSRRTTLGKHGQLTPEQARKLAKARLGDVAHGRDPAEEKLNDRQAPTVADLAADYLVRHAIPNKRPKSVHDDRSFLDRVILPKIGAKKVAEIGRRDIEEIVLGLEATPYQANRLRALLSKMFNLAVGWEWRTTNPVTGVPKFQEHKRDRWLSVDELIRLRKVLDALADQRIANAIRLLLLTGARRSEVFTAEWDQFDLETGVWTKPSHLTKQKRTEHTPLSTQAVELLRAIHADADPENPYVFPGDRPGRPLNDIKKTWDQVRSAADLEDLRLHDLRHTFASHLASSGLSLPIVGRLLGHTQPQTTARYAHLADEPLRSAANHFGDVFEQSADKREPKETP